MNGFDLAAASIGLAASALAAALLLPLWRRAPVPAYRLVVCVLAAALALPLLQWGARALDLPVPHPARELALALGAGAPTLPSAEPVGEPLVLFTAPEEATAEPFAAALPERTATMESAAASAPRTWPWTSLLLALWAAGALWALASTARRLLATRRLFARARPVADAARLAVWDAVRAGSRLGARTRLCESHAVRTPACAGLWRPAVVLPADDTLAGRPELLACVLTHELVHLERRDPWVLLGEELLRATFWFHPAAWWLVARLGALRELSCDCLVVRRTGKRKRYASALVEYATWMQTSAPRATWAAVVPWSESRGHLTRRIEMLLQPETQPKTGRVVAPAAVGVLMTFLWSGQLALATSSCAGTRESHEPAHAHAHAHAKAESGQATCASEPCEVQVVARDGKPLVYRVHGELAEDGDSGDGKRVERRVIVLGDGEGEPKVLRGDEAKAWIEAQGMHATVGTTQSRQALEQDIRGAWLEAKGGEHEVIVIDGDKIQHKAKVKATQGEPVEVIVVGPDGARRVRGAKLAEPFGRHGESADGNPRFQIRRFGEQGVEGQPGHNVWRFHEGQDGKAVELGSGESHLDSFPKVHGKLHGQAHGVEGALLHGDLFEAQADGASLDQLRRELEATRAALEEQRRMLEELRAQLQKQREKTDTVGARGR